MNPCYLDLLQRKPLSLKEKEEYTTNVEIRMKSIPLVNGGYTIVDDDVFEAVGHLKWWRFDRGKFHKRSYAYRTEKKANGKYSPLYLHRHVTDAPKGKVVDHLNYDGLDNRKSNLNICTDAQNLARRRPTRGRRGGIYLHKRRRTWDAGFNWKKKRYNIASCKTKEDAEIYLDVARQLFADRWSGKV